VTEVQNSFAGSNEDHFSFMIRHVAILDSAVMILFGLSFHRLLFSIRNDLEQPHLRTALYYAFAKRRKSETGQ
jgi:hypothetical protein